ncbi:N-acetylglucosamine-6-phosphate deacetylase [Marinihelvus fidelis]|uniref:N-acetylglucosamine-6-phosphate deacetylase n=1 Tax=Marinihelvus fidelis TaxID=2613842 RepID=A0A5N0TCV7_9GAMM|nr:N-acetylglucosamine-6-phosphate deacetylase [Marinihelvus fidelis]KAA9132800.1 N-acetylglucosamine-6-phosphate deacetylase [Marinihelvus fidelis]
MTRTALVNGRVFDGDTTLEDATVVVDDGVIAEVRAASDGATAADKTIDLHGRWLAPGLIDIQVNGGGGRLLNDDPSVDTIRTMGAAHRRFGTTGFLPTLISDSADVMCRALTAVRQATAEGVPGVLGIHVEGPFLDPGHRGIHDDRHFRPISDEDIELLTPRGDEVVLLTIAPERYGPTMVRRMVDAGIRVYGGHSGATFEQAREALDAGLSGFTHLFNAMTPFTSRAPGMVGAALQDPNSYVGLIADGHHVHPASVAVAHAAKARDRMLLVTDAMSTIGAEGDSFEWNGETIHVADGALRLADGRLAGSHLDMISAVRNMARFTGIDRTAALRMAATVPAMALGRDHELGYIRPGYRASLVELDDDFSVVGSWIDGQREAYREPG